MKKILYLFMFVLLFVSCNASILMNNGEMEKPQKIEREEKKEYFFSTCGASQISATKSYYKDRIVHQSTEELLKINGYYKVWDCGYTLMEFKKRGS